MTMCSGPGSQLVDMVRRLRARPLSSWRHGDRERVTRLALQRLADLAAEASGEPPRAVPDAGIGALPDQLAVLAAEATSAGVPEDALEPVVENLSRALGLR